MIKNISIGVTNTIRAYLGESLVWQAPPKLSANFITGEYKASGVTKTFAEVFDFNRAGKAWLVKETGLVEYAVDTPRFDDGLLIEQAATNLATSRNVVNCTWNGNNVSLTTESTFGYFGFAVYYAIGRYMTSTIHIKSEHTAFEKVTIGDAGITTFTVNVKDATYVKTSDHALTLDPTMKISKVNGRSKIVFTRSGSENISTSMRYTPPSSAYTAIGNNLAATALYEQHEIGKVSSSYIPTTTAPVTRPADFIQSKVTCTAITGDWDSTLTLSISNGQIVHSGYGRIRSLEIN
ncbi:hypothetical protein [Psychrobacter sp. ASPA161_6]|uniref:hypothetical protein n=1 Tax=Psychrobacter sp. ASPA161_6 TaxID=3160962 RepID=UPI003F820BE3